MTESLLYLEFSGFHRANYQFFWLDLFLLDSILGKDCSRAPQWDWVRGSPLFCCLLSFRKDFHKTGRSMFNITYKVPLISNYKVWGLKLEKQLFRGKCSFKLLGADWRGHQSYFPISSDHPCRIWNSNLECFSLSCMIFHLIKDLLFVKIQLVLKNYVHLLFSKNLQRQQSRLSLVLIPLRDWA